MKHLLAISAIALATTTAANAVTITVGYWDPAIDNNLHVVATSPGTKIDIPELPTTQVFGTWFGGAIAVIQNGYDIFAVTPITTTQNGAEIRIYASFQGLTAPSPLGSFTSQFWSFDTEQGLTGTDQIFICGNGGLFCDNRIIGGGTMLDSQTFNDQLGLVNASFIDGSVPSTYTITEVFDINAAFDCFGSQIAVDPEFSAVPGPIVGAGLPGILGALGFGAWSWRRKRRLI